MGVIKYIILVTLLSEVIIWGIKKWAVLQTTRKIPPSNSKLTMKPYGS